VAELVTRSTHPVLALGDAPGHLVRLAQQRHTQLWSEEFGGDLTGPQYAVIASVGSDGGSIQRIVGERASLDKSSTADVVARLQSQGWLRLSRDPADGRRKCVNLTPLARTALPEVTRRVGLVQQRLLDPVAPGQRAAFVQVMTKVAYAGAVPDGEATTNALLLRDTPGHLIRRTQQVHTAAWATEVGSALTATQYAVISALWSRPDGIDQTTAGQLAALDKSTMADVAARLMRRGWVARSRDPDDARCYLLRLTDTARTDLPEVTVAVRRVQERLLTPLPAPGQRSAFLAGYRALAYPDGGP
jgi:MarR family transcriptional regulator, lower aerobic nicotinate degradation pathway regulator